MLKYYWRYSSIDSLGKGLLSERAFIEDELILSMYRLGAELGNRINVS
ncbi:MAG: hypothetical protein AAGC88_07675 [Bacteroidota bacterium]